MPVSAGGYGMSTAGYADLREQGRNAAQSASWRQPQPKSNRKKWIVRLPLSPFLFSRKILRSDFYQLFSLFLDNGHRTCPCRTHHCGSHRRRCGI